MRPKHVLEGSPQRRTNVRISRVFARYGTLCGSSHPVDLFFDEIIHGDAVVLLVLTL